LTTLPSQVILIHNHPSGKLKPSEADLDLTNKLIQAGLLFDIEIANHVNGIENFWSQAKRHLRRYNGIPKKTFHLFLKECEWRFNFGPAENLFKT